MPPGQRVQLRGYVPATIVTGKVNKRDEVAIRFDRTEGLRWFPAEKVRAALAERKPDVHI